MAFSSSSYCDYDVFLSFRGEDTRDNFISHLNAALYQKKIKTFVDDEGLRRGDEISPALFDAIEGSKISVIIFSKNYCSSKWCLNELVKILQCHERNGQMVVPVFYHVDPSHVRNQNGIFGEAFVKHEEQFKDIPEKVMNWRAALTQASNLSGWASKEIRSEAKLVNSIVMDILRKLNNVTTSTCIDGFVGLNSRLEEIKSLLCIGSPDFRIVGIWGMGGIGKTTIAEVIFNQNSSEFEGKCFLANVREESEKCGGLIYLRDRVLHEILGENINVATSNLPEYIRIRLRRMKVLIVLDDVIKVRQLQYLTGGLDQFGQGSRIIITTRDRWVLDNFGVCSANIYQVKGLDSNEARKLFYNFAFRGNHCPGDLLELSNRVLEYVNGNPLALRVLGSFFHQKNKLDWEKALEHLNGISDPDIYATLKISYNDLQSEVKSIFLDIACFFVGEDKNFVRRVLEDPDIPHYGLNLLVEKSLITMSRFGQIQMHGLLQQMGREIVRHENIKNPSKRSRLWHHEDVYHVLEKNKGTDVIEGIFLNLSRVKDIHLASGAFAKMRNLRLLKLYVPEYGVAIMHSKVHLDQGLECLPEELRYLHWHGYPLKTLPSVFELENLIELNLPHSEVEQLWEGEMEALKLMSMDLHHSQCLVTIPKPSKIPNIQKLNLSNCKSFPCFSSSHILHNFSSPSLLSSLSTLVSLDLSYCALVEIPEDIGCLSSLASLDLRANNFESLPVSMKKLSQLGSLDLTNCGMLRSLPELPLSVTSLRASNCEQLQSLPKFASCSDGLDISLLEILHGRSWNEPTQMDFRFTNCRSMKDSQQIFQTMVIASLISVQEKDVGPYVSSICLPGRRIPDWISDRSSSKIMYVDQPQHRGNGNFIGFAVCLETPDLDYNPTTRAFVDFYCAFYISTPSGASKRIRKDFQFNLNRDVSHFTEQIVLGFCPCFDVELPDADHHTTATFNFDICVDFYPHGVFPMNPCLWKCGVCPVYLSPNAAKPNSLTINFGASSSQEECMTATYERVCDEMAGTIGWQNPGEEESESSTDSS